MKIGFFGGAFNPPTNAHIYLAKKVLDICKLDKVIFVPMGGYYKKANLAKAEDRYNMLKLVCLNSNNKNLEVSDIEISVNKKMYAIDAFKLIENAYQEDNTYFIMGADNFTRLKEWKDNKELIQKYKYIVLERGNVNLKEYLEENVDLKECILKIIPNQEYKEYSSTEFRNLFSKDKSMMKDMVPEEVFDYILENNIY